MEKKNCIHCNEPFETDNIRRNYCSPTCRKAAHDARKRESKNFADSPLRNVTSNGGNGGNGQPDELTAFERARLEIIQAQLEIEREKLAELKRHNAALEEIERNRQVIHTPPGNDRVQPPPVQPNTPLELPTYEDDGEAFEVVVTKSKSNANTSQNFLNSIMSMNN